MKRIVVAAAISVGACAPELVAEYPGAGGPCDPLYRYPATSAAPCSYDWRAGYVALAGQAVPRPGALVKIENETQGILDRVTTPPR